jgi:pimeloyl-ACP methyl ester carboxylesterase
MAYAQVGDLNMYYDVHGQGRPLVLLHGAYQTADTMGPLVPGLAESRRVVVPEMQAHGRTADIDRPITYEQMADDTSRLMRELGFDDADIVGYSMGGAIGLQIAVRHPELVRKLVIISSGFASDSAHPEALEMFPSISPEMFAGSPIEQEYKRIAPNPDDFPNLVWKLKDLDTTEFSWPEEDIRAIAAPTMIVVGDSDAVTLEHVVKLFRLRGGGVMGDLSGLPDARLAVLPATTHYIPPGSGILDRSDWLLAMIPPFLDA